jgi:hypothetical protein
VAGPLEEALGASPWLLMSGFGGVLVGSLHVILKVRSYAGGGVGTLRRAVAGRRQSVYVILGVDYFGGVAVALIALAAGLSQPGWLVSLVSKTPWFGWIVLGGAGPLLSDRLLTGSVVRGRYESWLARNNPDDWELASRAGLRNLQSGAWRLRNEAVRSIELYVWVIVQRRLILEAKRLRTQALQLIRDQPEDARELIVLVDRLGMNDLVTLPQEVIDAAARITPGCSIPVLQELLDALVNELVNSQIWWPLEVLCGDAPG